MSLLVLQDSVRGPYELSIPVAITDAAGVIRRIIVDIPAQPRASIRLPGQYPQRPRALSFDPDRRLLARVTRM